MRNVFGSSAGRPALTALLATAWPAIAPGDSKLQQRKKLAIRGGHVAMIIMILAVVVATAVAHFQGISRSRLVLLVLTSLVYIAWNLHGTHGVVRMVLWESTAPPPPRSERLPPWGALPYFSIQLVLAGVVYGLGDLGHIPNLVWLALLPPVAYSVFLLERAGIILVSAGTLLVFVFNVVRFHGWAAVPYGLLAFSFAMAFTLVFTLLTVSSEKARDEVQRLATELGEANRKLREYAVQVEELAATRERNRLAREIHDTLGHYLTVVNVQLEASRALRERDPLGARQALDKAQTLTQEGLRDIRHSVAALRSSPLDNKSLPEALRQLVAENQSGGLTTALEVRGLPRALPPQAELTLYRAAQEGLTNVRKHASARRASIVLDFQAPATVTLRLSDDGTGTANHGASATGFGLLGVRERVNLLAGRLTITSAPNQGFTLELGVPG
jgi:signal transduction histidine kinase